MKAKSYADVRRDMVESNAVSASADDEYLPCLYCPGQAMRKTLAKLGARCEACYEQYLRSGFSGDRPPVMAKQAAWVRAESDRCRQAKARPGVFAEVAQRLQSERAKLSSDPRFGQWEAGA